MSSRVISVITAVHAPMADLLQDAYASLVKQELPSGWKWEWLVQEDSLDGQIAKLLPVDKRIKFGSGKPGGPGVARTVALARATGELVKVLDADDQLTAGALARDIALLTERPEVGWTTSRVLDLLPDGTQISWKHQDPEEGPIARRSIVDFWLNNEHRLPVHPATLCIRRQLLLALGGWMALPASEDTGLLLAANVLSDGYFIEEPGLLYRKWSGQTTMQATFIDEEARVHRTRIVEDRARALLALMG
ncbi:glycosyltransferase family 2 protein [Micromonospora sp. NPDC049366]|uniref:glycosyltransferase family 2 protein n=1 Tax=Micromonospora sp. NPDC049366 TaxID=3364271 RepID=UPI00379039B8